MKTISDVLVDFANVVDPDLRATLTEGLRLVEGMPEPPQRDEVGERRDELALERARAEDEKARQLQEWVDVWGIPFVDAQQIIAGEIQDTAALAAVRKLLDQKVWGAILCLSGPNGCGKSFAASWLVAQGPPRPYPFGGSWPRERHPRFISVGVLQRVSLYGDDADWKAIANASVLAIDDVGTEYKDDKGAFAARFDQLIAHREKSPCWTVITTNLVARAKGAGEDSFAGKYGERVFDRLRRLGSGMSRLQGDSLRHKNRETQCPTPKPTNPSTPSGSTARRP